MGTKWKARSVRINRKLGVLLGGLMMMLTLGSAVTASAGNQNPAGPQAPLNAKDAAAVAAAPDSCQFWSQMHPAEQKYRNVNNVPFTYNSSAYGINWFNVACGHLTFTVRPGQEALVDLVAVAELDCQSTATPPSNSWCDGRFLINGLPLARPDNSNRGDTYAWDSANGGNFDWQAHTLHQVYRARCAQNATAPCPHRVQLQSRLVSGATSLWLDDLTMSVDVTEGAIMVVNGPTTP